MMDFELKKEIDGLKGDLNITKLAINSVQIDMKEQLTGEMGEDMSAVLNGERIVKVGTIEKHKFKIKSWLKKIFRMF